MTVADTTTFLQMESDGEYREKARDHLSSHQLADFRRCPLLYRKKTLGLIPDEDRLAYLVGRAAHTLILEGGVVFENGYAVGGPINPRTGSPFGVNTKAYARWAAEQGRPVLTDTQFDLVTQLAAAVMAHDQAQRLLTDGVPEGVVRAAYRGVPCQTRMDWFSLKYGIVDLKTCDDLSWFESDARRYGYAHQLAFYQAILAKVSGTTSPVHIIAVEKRQPFRCGVWRVSGEVLGTAQKDNEAAIERLKVCRERDHWPTGYEEVRTLDWI